MIQINEEERFEDDEILEPEKKKNIKDAREKIEEKRRRSQEQITESLMVTIHQTPKKEKERTDEKEKKNQEVQTPGSRLDRHPNEIIGRRLLDRVGDVHWRHFPGINSLTDFNCDPCMKFNREQCHQTHPHREGDRVVRDICEICRFAAALNNHHSAENCDLESKLDSFVARQKRQEREQHNKRHMRTEEGGKEKGEKRRKGEGKPKSK